MTVALMLKAPIPGLCKTRLAECLGDPAAAAAIYRSLVERQVKEIPPDYEAIVHFTPPDAEAAMRRWLGDRFSYRPQCEGDLGARLTVAMREAFQSGALSVLFLGGDCPTFDRRHFEETALCLTKSDVVLVPAIDGGYCMLATRRCEPMLFQAINWSTAAVLEQTLARCSQAGLTVSLMEAMEDVDDLASYERARPAIEQIGGANIC